LNGGRKRAAVAKADDGVIAMFDLALEIARPRMTERAKRQALFAKIWRDLAILQSESLGEPRLQFDALDDIAVDRDFDDTIGDGPRNQPMRLDGGDTEAPGHVGLRQPAGVVKPGGPDCKRIIGIRHRRTLPISSTATPPDNNQPL
jgi:hypothetical protein